MSSRVIPNDCISPSNGLDRTGIPGQLLVHRQQRNAFNLRLRHEYPVKRVIVNRRQLANRKRVIRANRKFPVTASQKAVSQLPRVNAKVASAERALDHDLPDARRAERQLGAGIAQEVPSCRRQPLWLASRPQQDVGVQ